MSNIVIFIRDNAVEVQFPGYCQDGYLDWYSIVSHPHIIPLAQSADDVGLSHAGRPSHYMSLPPLGMTD